MKKLLVILLLVGACSSQTVTTGAAAVVLAEFSISATGSLTPGPNKVDITNAGEFGHTLVIADETGTVIGATGVVGSDNTASLSVDLQPGTYELTCRIVVQREDGSLVDHYQEGMVTTIEVSAP